MIYRSSFMWVGFDNTCDNTVRAF